jgi:ABC-type glycerol-3-phosphate transport system substrate-binding protein
MKQRRLWPAVLVTALALAGCGNSAGSSKAGSSGSASGPLTVWVDAVRLPVAQAYARAHPSQKLNIVTFDGDGGPG